MGLKKVFAVVLCITALLGPAGLAAAEEYSPGQFLGLDLSKALLSPKRLGPETEFAPVAIEAKTDGASAAAQARAEPKGEPGKTVPRTRVARQHADEPRGAARTKLARRHGNPLDAEARDTRIQVWPCRSGGICEWQR